MAKKFGVASCLNTSDKNFLTEIKKLTSGGADYCIESAGRVSTIELGFSLIKSGGGKLLFASHPPEGESIKLIPHELIAGKQIAGSWGRQRTRRSRSTHWGLRSTQLVGRSE